MQKLKKIKSSVNRLDPAVANQWKQKLKNVQMIRNSRSAKPKAQKSSNHLKISWTNKRKAWEVQIMRKRSRSSVKENTQQFQITAKD